MGKPEIFVLLSRMSSRLAGLVPAHGRASEIFPWKEASSCGGVTLSHPVMSSLRTELRDGTRVSAHNTNMMDTPRGSATVNTYFNKGFTMGDKSPKAKQKSQKQDASAKAQKKADGQKFVPAEVTADQKKKR